MGRSRTEDFDGLGVRLGSLFTLRSFQPGWTGVTQSSAVRPSRLMLAAWAAVLALLVVSFGFFLRFAWGAMLFPFGLDYAEGEIWRQANAIPGPRMYGDINAYPWIAFEYPPLFYIIANAAAHFTTGFLQAGRLLSTLSSLLAAGLVARLVYQGVRYSGARLACRIAACVAALLLFTLVPVIAFATLVHVDMLAIVLSLGGVVLAAAALTRPALLYFAVLMFVAAVFVKQACIAAPAAVLLVWGYRDPRLTLRAYAVGAAVGTAVCAWLSWLTDGGFLRHIFTYNINIWRLHNLLVLVGNVARDCGIVIDLCCMAVVLHWAVAAGRPGFGGARDVVRRVRRETETAFFALMTAYLVLSGMSTVLAGKNGASVNYFVESLSVCCIWVGFLVAMHIGAGAALAARPAWQRVAFTLILPALLAWPVVSEPATFLANMNFLYGPNVERQDEALMAAVRGIDKPILSDDIALLLVAGKQAPVEPFIFAELAAAGLWDENKLVGMLQDHQFGGVITYKDPGDVTFDVRFRPRTAQAILKYYPRVVRFGETRLRLPE